MPFFQIADLTLEIWGVENDFFKMRFAEYSLDGGTTPDIKIDFTSDKLVPNGQLISVADGFRQYYSQDDQYGIFDLLKEPDYYCAGLVFDKEVKSARATLEDISVYGGMSNEVRSFNMLGELFRYFILKHDGLVLHSSCIKYKNSGIAFSAPSGTGKSTHTGLWKKCFPEEVTILNDDSPAIRLGEYVPELCGTPWSGKTEINTNKGAPLEAIVILEQNPQNHITKLSTDEAVFRILQEVTRPRFEEFMELTLGAVEKLILKIPVYLLRCNISDEAVMMVKNELGL